QVGCGGAGAGGVLDAVGEAHGAFDVGFPADPVLLLGLVVEQQAFPAALFLGAVGGVAAAGIVLGLFVDAVEFDDPGDGGVEEGAVVADGEHAAGVGAQPVAQP